MENRSGKRSEFSRKLKGVIIGLGLIAGLACFEAVNFKTSLSALTLLVGYALAILLAIGCCCLDFFGLFRITPPKISRQTTGESPYETLLFFVWLMASGVNAALTAFAVYYAMQGNATLQLPSFMYVAIPILIALLTWSIRIGLIVSIRVKGWSIFSLTEQSRQSAYANQ